MCPSMFYSLFNLGSHMGTTSVDSDHPLHFNIFSLLSCTKQRDVMIAISTQEDSAERLRRAKIGLLAYM